VFPSLAHSLTRLVSSSVVNDQLIVENTYLSLLSASLAASVVVGQNKLQILHSSDNESSFQDPNTLEEKVIHYSALVDGLQQLAASEGIPSLHLTAGDHSIPGPFYEASAEVDEYGQRGLADIDIFNAFPNLANGFGNHEFDGGIDDISYMIAAANYPMLAVNLDFSNAVLAPESPPLQIGEDAGPCADNAGSIVKSCHLPAGANLTVGLIGRAPFDFFNVLEAGAVPGVDFVGGRDPDTQQPLESAVPMVLEQVDLLTAQGASVIILLDHAQDFTGDPLSTELLRGIDVIITAGSTGFMAASEPNGPFNFLRDGDMGENDYPTVRQDSEGKTVLIVNTDQLYAYIGQLIVEFDDAGDVVGYDDMRSGPIATTPEAIELLRAELGVDTLEPIPAVREALDLLQQTPTITQGFQEIGSTATPLNGARGDVRGRETNLGRVAADSTLWEANTYASANGLPAVDIALKNGGGIRDSIVGPSIIRLTIEAALAFDNNLALVELTAPQLIATMENAVSRVPATDGRFPQIAGMYVEFDISVPGVESAESLETPTRVKTLTVSRADGTEDTVIMDFMAMGDLSRTFVMATNSFLLTGGDGYASLTVGIPLGETELGEQDILESYIVEELGGTVDMEDPPADPRVELGCRSIAEIALAAGNFNILYELVLAAGLGDAISVPGPLTLLAPTDDAFAKLPEGTVDALKADPVALAGILTYHVAGGEVLSSDLTDGQTLIMLNQKTVTVSITEDMVMMNDAMVISADVLACNGVIHVLDTVLIPTAAETSDAPTPADGGGGGGGSEAPTGEDMDMDPPTSAPTPSAATAATGVGPFVAAAMGFLTTLLL
jgi:2',3'-cyclic-nucleotide 2'-phosphodiesterase (5'-nucleotidase family)/uncharacterized surface protein with fasciclin (FAS1) repeats